MESEVKINRRTVRMRRGTSDVGIITFYADFDEAELPKIMGSVENATVAAIKIEDWNSELSPWEADPVFGEDGFGCGADDTLAFITGEVLPVMGCQRYVIAGYSLAGLFALWACYESESFEGCIAASPSVWFPGWDTFISSHRMKAGKVYLSLGRKEPNTRNQVMRTVGDRIELQFGTLSHLGDDCILEWNDGGHFQDYVPRMSRSFAWMMGRIQRSIR